MGGFMFAFLKKKKSIYLAVRWRGEYPSLSPTLSWITALACTVSTTQAEQLADQTVRQPFCLSFSFSTRAATVQQHALQVRAYLTFSYTVACTVHCCVLKVILFGSFSVVFYKTNFFNFFSFQLWVWICWNEIVIVFSISWLIFIYCVSNFFFCSIRGLP